MDRDLRIRWGMIGVGSVAEHKSGPAFVRAEGGRLAGVASRREEAARAYATRHGVPLVFRTPSELIASDQIDAVYIATPPASHAPLALEVARAGKPCCIEKPMTVYLHEAEQVKRAFDAAKLPLFVSYYRRSLPRFEAISDAMRAGAIGMPRSVDWTLERVRTATGAGGHWRTAPHEAPGGLFEDLACHGLDLFDSMFGPVATVDGSLSRIGDGRDVPDRVEAWWRHGTAVSGHGVWDFDADARRDTVVIQGDAGEIRFAMFDEAPVEVESADGVRRIDIAHPVPIQLPHVAAMNGCLAGRGTHPSTGESAIRTAWAMEQMLRGPHARMSAPDMKP